MDNVRSDHNIIHEVFPGADVIQDVKHMINRIVETMSKKSEVYGAACEKLHEKVVGSKINVRSRTGKVHEIPGRLPDAADMVKGLEHFETEYKALDPSLFLDGYTEAVANQKALILEVS